MIIRINVERVDTIQKTHNTANNCLVFLCHFIEGTDGMPVTD